MQIGHHCAWSFTTYGLLGLAASTGEIVGTVGVAFRTYMTEATATNPRTCKATADPDEVSVRMPNCHLAITPRHVGWWPRNSKSLIDAMLMDGVSVICPYRHPHALVW